MVVLLAEKGRGGDARDGRGCVAWTALPAAEMLTDGSVAGTTYVGRYVAVLRTTKKAGSGWIIDGAPTLLFYILFIFSWVPGEKMRERERFYGDCCASKSIRCSLFCLSMHA